jgi:signal peptidase II
MGNLGDRIFRAPGLFRGYVVDWIGVVPRYYPIFNLADSAIVCGGILTVILAMRGFHLDGTRSVDGSRADGSRGDKHSDLSGRPAGAGAPAPRDAESADSGGPGEP